jgi:hypothetical protein
VVLEGGERLAVAVPQPRRLVGGGGQDAAAVGREQREVLGQIGLLPLANIAR